jgi:putative ABC transport system substrate-binding protein
VRSARRQVATHISQRRDASSRTADLKMVLTRRALLGGLAASSLALPLIAGCSLKTGQPPQVAVRRVGFLTQEAVPPVRMEALKAGLRFHGWTEGQNLVFEERNADGRTDQLANLAAELVGQGVDVIIGPGDAPIRAARQVSANTPIVMLTVGDPVGEGYVDSLARPGGMITGLTNLAPGLTAKRLELLHDVAPRASRIAHLLANTATSPGQLTSLREVQSMAAGLGLQVRPFEARTADELDSALEQAGLWLAEALIVPPSVLFISLRTRIADWAARTHVPAIYSAREYIEAGGLMSYGPDIVAIYRRGADYVDRILHGAHPAEMPIEQPSSFDFIVNESAERMLGTSISALASTDVTEWLS